jgi:NifU-like protein involved in Fe-S cluster formation
LSAPLYGEVIADHARNPRNRGALELPDAAQEGVNPLCGDRVRIELRIRDRRVVVLRFQAEACMVSVAAASILGELLNGVPVEARKLGVSGTVRASVQVYSTRAEIDALAATVDEARAELR